MNLGDSGSEPNKCLASLSKRGRVESGASAIPAEGVSPVRLESPLQKCHVAQGEGDSCYCLLFEGEINN